MDVVRHDSSVTYTYNDINLTYEEYELYDETGLTYDLGEGITIEFIDVVMLEKSHQYRLYCFDPELGLFYIYLDKYMRGIPNYTED